MKLTDEHWESEPNVETLGYLRAVCPYGTGIFLHGLFPAAENKRGVWGGGASINVVSASERAELDAWLAAQDEAEDALLLRKSGEPLVAELRTQVRSALVQVGTITGTIQRLTAENDTLRRDVEMLRQQLAARPISRPA